MIFILIKNSLAVFTFKILRKDKACFAAAAKSLQSCLTPCDPIDGSPPVSPIPGILQARTLEWVAISFSNAWKGKVKVKSLSRVWLFTTPWTAAHQAPPSMEFSRQEYWSGVPLPSQHSANQDFCSRCLHSSWQEIDHKQKIKIWQRRIWAGPYRDRPSHQILCFNSSLKCLNDSIWCTFPELFCRC